VIALVLLLSLVPPLRRADGRLFLVAIAGWAVGRAIVASTWRDPVAVGPFRAEQAIDLLVAVAAAALAIVLILGRRGAEPEELRPGDPSDAADRGLVGPTSRG
jgi:hypothetical protein